MNTPVPKTPPSQSRTSSSLELSAPSVCARADTKPVMKSLADPPKANRVAPSKASDDRSKHVRFGSVQALNSHLQQHPSK
eukprot:Skav201142  [mRNA]  locus=scaffold3142:16557:26382:- [translate_table: standard]